MSKSQSSAWYNFVHDLITVDSSQIDLYTGVRYATLLVALIVVGLITKHVAEASLVLFGTFLTLVIDEMRSKGKGSRTGVLLTTSVVYASIFAISVIISMSGYLVVPLLGAGLFIISYLRVFPRAFLILMLASIVFVVGITTQDASINLAGLGFLLFVVGGLWAILGGIIFPARKNSKEHPIVKEEDSVQVQQPQLKSTLQDKFKPLTSNLSLHSQYFQYAIALAATSVFGLLVAQSLELPQRGWVVLTITVLLLPSYSDISFTFRKVVHNIIGTLIGATIAAIIIGNVEDQWLLSFFLFIFATIVIASLKVKNYAFFTIFVTALVLILGAIPNPSTELVVAPLHRIVNIFIACMLSLLAASIIYVTIKQKGKHMMKNE